MPVRMQEEDIEEPKPRAAKVYKMRLVKSSAAMKAAPYVIHQILTGRDSQPSGDRATGRTTVRTIFGVYNDDEQEGALMLLNLMERLRISLLKKVLIADQYMLDLEDGIDTIIYSDDTWPYYAGEMLTTWNIPAVERELGEFYV